LNNSSSITPQNGELKFALIIISPKSHDISAILNFQIIMNIKFLNKFTVIGKVKNGNLAELYHICKKETNLNETKQQSQK
jgi:hypothetical protein